MLFNLTLSDRLSCQLNIVCEDEKYKFLLIYKLL